MCKITTATPAEKCYFYVLFNDQKHILGTVTRRTAEKTAHMMVKDYTRIKWSDRNNTFLVWRTIWYIKS